MPDSHGQTEMVLDPSTPTRIGASFVKLGKPTPSKVYATYWKFAAERQAIFFRRLTSRTEPWTSDTILQIFKFTNAYRASDRVSQYLIRNVIYGNNYGFKDICFRVLLFKVFNRIETWEHIEQRFGPIALSDFDWEHCAGELDELLTRGCRIYSAAYIMPSGGPKGGRKHRFHLSLLKDILASGFAERVLEAESMEKLYSLLLDVPSFGPFLSYQFATDLAYSDQIDLSEMEFVMPGPGALDGIKKVFLKPGDLSPADIIRYMADRQEQEFEKYELDFKSLWGRSLQLIDCQNLFCEVDKYARIAHPDIKGVSGRSRIKQRFQSQQSAPIPFYPPRWSINDKVEMYLGSLNRTNGNGSRLQIEGHSSTAFVA